MPENFSESDNPNLYLVGFMGTGKSTLGRRLAQRLGYAFIDSDCEIEKNSAMKITDIFKNLGEPAFRKMERDFIESQIPPCGCVVACGGGLVCREGMPELVRSKGVCIALFSSAEEIFERVKNGKSRPLLNVENPLQRISDMMETRTPFYLKSGIAIAADKELEATEEHILRVYYDEIKRRKKDLLKLSKKLADK